MGKKIAIGHVVCHVCGLDADVKVSEKSGMAYTFCGDCNVQSFCRNKNQHEKLLAKMRPVTVTEIRTMPAFEGLKQAILPPVTVTEKKPAFSLGGL